MRSEWKESQLYMKEYVRRSYIDYKIIPKNAIYKVRFIFFYRLISCSLIIFLIYSNLNYLLRSVYRHSLITNNLGFWHLRIFRKNYFRNIFGIVRYLRYIFTISYFFKTITIIIRSAFRFGIFEIHDICEIWEFFGFRENWDLIILWNLEVR